MKVLITGGAGYIGTELAQELSKNPMVRKVVIYDNLSRPSYNLFIGKTKLSSDKLEFVHGDLLDSRKLKKALDGINTVVHLAAKVSTPFAEQNSHSFEQINHWGTAELVYAIEESSSVNQLVYLSSASVYGSSSDYVDVDCEINPRTFYGISKMRGEDHVYRLFSKMPTYIARCGNVYGYSKSMRFDAVINRFMFDAHFNRKISINGSGDQHRAFIHINKVTSFLSNLIQVDWKSNKFDLVDRVISVNEIANTLQEIYPDLERIHINQHLSLKEIKVRKNNVINQLINVPEIGLKEELLTFKDQFAW